jgi:hypothetical protein
LFGLHLTTRAEHLGRAAETQAVRRGPGAFVILIKSRRFQVALGGYVPGIGLTWSLVVRRFLDG